MKRGWISLSQREYSSAPPTSPCPLVLHSQSSSEGRGLPGSCRQRFVRSHVSTFPFRTDQLALACCRRPRRRLFEYGRNDSFDENEIVFEKVRSREERVDARRITAVPPSVENDDCKLRGVRDRQRGLEVLVVARIHAREVSRSRCQRKDQGERRIIEGQRSR